MRFFTFFRNAALLCFLLVFASLSLNTAYARRQFPHGYSRWSIQADIKGGFTTNLSGPDNNAVYGAHDDVSSTFYAYNGALTSSFGAESIHFASEGTQQDECLVMLKPNTTIHVTLQWQTLNGISSVQDDPPPSHVKVVIRRSVYAGDFRYGFASNMPFFAEPSFDVNISQGLDGASTSSSDTYENGSITRAGDKYHQDPYTTIDLPVNASGKAEYTFNPSFNMDISCDHGLEVYLGNQGYGMDIWVEGIEWWVDFAIEGVNLNRFNRPDNSMGGGNSGHGHDPTFTRWLPLAFSPYISGQPIHYAPGDLPTPWGNMTCMYSLALQQEPDGATDGDGTTTLYYPLAGPNGYDPSNPAHYGFATAPSSNATAPKYVITDAQGGRLLYDAGWGAFPNVHSTLTRLGNGLFKLSQAGAPEDLASKGRYTYTFQQVSSGAALLQARLISIKDEQGNEQTLSWGDASNPLLPLLAVTDQTSHRHLLFNAGPNGRIGAVIATENDGTTPHTRTDVQFDMTGHFTEIDVKSGDGSVTYSTETFGYNGDALIANSYGFTTIGYTVVADNTSLDPFGNPTPRVEAIT